MKTVRGRSVAAAAGAALCLLSAGLPANAALRASRPGIVYFRASAKSLPATGGTVQLSTAVRAASTCRFTSAPLLPGLPAKVSCASGLAKHKVSLPANHTASQKSYKFGLTVSGSGGTATATPITVVVREAPPAVSKVAVQPADLPAAGGATVLSAMVSRSAQCTVSANPAVAGLPVTKACSAGSTAVRVAVPVTLPALAGTTAQQYSLTLTVTGPGGTSSAPATGTVWPAMTFSAPVTVDAPAGFIGAVSCVSAAFCMGMDLADGAAARWDGTSWSAPVRIETGPYLDSGYNINVSCVSPSFCLALDASGNSFAYDGTSWSATSSPGLSPVALSCASPAFCLAVSKTQATIFNGSSWSPPVTVTPSTVLHSVSCASESFCMAVDGAGQAFTYTSSGWDTGTLISMTSFPKQVSCASTTLCAVINGSGQAYLYNGSWSSATTLNPSGSMDSVSCPPGTSFCMALSDGSYYTTDGSTWSGATALDPGKTSVLSCASSTSCMVTEGSAILVLDGTSWTKSAAPRGPLHGFTYSVSCPTRSFCMAVDWYGAYLLYNGTTWSSPRAISPAARAVDSVSCTSPAFCLAVAATNSGSTGGHLYTFDGTQWTDHGQIALPLSSVSCTGPSFCEMLSFSSNGSVYAATWNGTSSGSPAPLDSYPGFGPQPGEGYVSCATATFCVAVDQLGNAFTFNGSTWSQPTALVPGWTASLDAISCPATTFCAAIDAGGHEYTFNGTGWTAQTSIDSAGQAQAISCTISHFCLMADLSGNVATFDGATWSAISNVDPVTTAGTGLTGVSCADAAHCVAVDWEGNALAGTG